MKKFSKFFKKLPARYLILAIIVAVAVSCVTVSGTFASFQTTVIGTGETPVSNWNFLVKINKDNADSNSRIANVKLAGDEDHPDNRDDNSVIEKYLIAPGTAGYMPVEIDGHLSQVSILVTITAYFADLPKDMNFYDNLGNKLDIADANDFMPDGMTKGSKFTDTTVMKTGEKQTAGGVTKYSSISYKYYFSYQEVQAWKNANLADNFIDVGFRWEWIDNGSNDQNYDFSHMYNEIRVTGQQVTNANQVSGIRAVHFADNAIAKSDSNKTGLVLDNANVLNILTKKLSGDTTDSTEFAIAPTKDFYLDVNDIEDNTSIYNVNPGDDVTKLVLGTNRREHTNGNDYKTNENRPTVKIDNTSVNVYISGDFQYTLGDGGVNVANINATTLVENMNAILDSHPASTMYDALNNVIANKAGTAYDDNYGTNYGTVAKLATFIAENSDVEGTDILWSAQTKKFVYLKDGKEVLIYNVQTVDTSKKVEFFKAYNDTTFTDIPQTYSIYLAGAVAGDLDTTVGIDEGENLEITAIKYTGTSEARNIIIRSTTASTDLFLSPYVNPTNSKIGDHITVIGKVGEISGPEDSYHVRTGLVIADNSLEICGKVVGIKVASGHIDLTEAVVESGEEIVILATTTAVKVSNPNEVNVHAHAVSKTEADSLNDKVGDTKSVGITWDYHNNTEQNSLDAIHHHITDEEAQEAVNAGTLGEGPVDGVWDYDTKVVEAKTKAIAAETPLAVIYRNNVAVQEYSDLQEAIAAALDGDVVQVNASVELNNGLHFANKRLTIRGKTENITITRRVDSMGVSFAEAMLTVGGNDVADTTAENTTPRTAPCSVTLESIIFDEEGKQGVVSYDKHINSMTWSWVAAGQTKQGGIIEYYEIGDGESDDLMITINLGNKAILRNFGGYSAICAHYSGGGYSSKIHGLINMLSGSIIEDTLPEYVHSGDATAIGEGYISKLDMKDGSIIRNISGASAYSQNKFDNATRGTSYNRSAVVTINGKIYNMNDGGRQMHLIGAESLGAHVINIGSTGEIYNNSYKSKSDQGIIFVQDSNSIIDIYGYIHDNECSYKGGALTVSTSGCKSLTIHTGAVLANNKSNREGSAIFVARCFDKVIIEDGVTITGNTVLNENNGGLVFGKNSNACAVEILGGTFTGNSGKAGPSDLVVVSGTTTITGGTFGCDVSTLSGVVIPSTHECINNQNGTWTVCEKAN